MLIIDSSYSNNKILDGGDARCKEEPIKGHRLRTELFRAVTSKIYTTVNRKETEG